MEVKTNEILQKNILPSLLNSGPPTATFYIKEFIDAHPELKSVSREDLGEEGMKLAEIIAEKIAKKVDEHFIS